MEIKTIDAPMLSKMLIAGAAKLESEKEWINELNVFPVPDGDTGTNMSLTIMSAVKEVEALENPDMKKLAKTISSGSLRGARGNSGVILSQLLRGFTKAISSSNEIDVQLLCVAAQRAVETAYKAVMKPKEGTILTVARGAADKALELVDTTDDLVYYIDEIIKEAEVVLAKTPDMLPVLKQAGVVDSGGQGLVEILKGAQDALLGRDVDYTAESSATDAEQAEEELKFDYSVEFAIDLNQPISINAEKEYKSYLGSIGEPVYVSVDGLSGKTKIATNDPGLVIQKALTLGSLSEIKVENVRKEQEPVQTSAEVEETPEETAEVVLKPEAPEEPAKDMGFVAVSIGAGLGAIFTELGADYLIEGGQTMNPCTEDFLEAIEKVNAKTVFLLPNNSNIILAANQAATICKDKEIIVLPTKTIPQGITALINFAPEESAKENEERMLEEIELVKTGQITYAIRDTVIDDKEISEGDYMGLTDSGIASVDADIKNAFMGMIDSMVDEDSAIVSIYYGQDATEESAQELADMISEKYPDLELEISEGDQPVYYYITSVE